MKKTIHRNLLMLIYTMLKMLMMIVIILTDKVVNFLIKIKTFLIYKMRK